MRERERRSELSRCSKKREDVFGALQYAASFHCLVEKWHDCEELKPKNQKRWTSVNQSAEAKKKTSSRMVRDDWQISIHEMRKKQQ